MSSRDNNKAFLGNKRAASQILDNLISNTSKKENYGNNSNKYRNTNSYSNINNTSSTVKSNKYSNSNTIQPYNSNSEERNNAKMQKRTLLKYEMDEDGNIIDSNGNIVELNSEIGHSKTLEINKKQDLKKQNKMNRGINLSSDTVNKDQKILDMKKSAYYDKSIDINVDKKRNKMKKFGLKFVEKGFYKEKNEEEEKSKAAKALGIDLKTAVLNKEEEKTLINIKFGQKINDSEDIIETKIQSNKNNDLKKDKINTNKLILDEFNNNELVLTENMNFSLKEKNIPNLEWWDECFVKTKNDTDNETNVNYINNDNNNGIFPFYSEDKVKKINKNLENTDIANTISKDSNSHYNNQILPIITKKDFDINIIDLNLDKITKYIQHPIPIKNEHLEFLNNSVKMPILLTKKERKRIKKRKRELINSELREKQHLGLIKAPEPRITYNNFMRILGSNAIQDPTKAEEVVKNAYKERMNRMLKDNESRKLSKEQRRDKIRKKFERSLTKECQVLLVKITNEPTKKQLYKLKKNAKQLYITGFIGNYEDCDNFMLYAEGSELGINKFKTLIIRRIKWNVIEQSSKETNEDDTKEKVVNLNKRILLSTENSKTSNIDCRILWQGLAKNKVFKRFRVVKKKNDTEFKNYLNNCHLEYFWNYLLTA